MTLHINKVGQTQDIARKLSTTENLKLNENGSVWSNKKDFDPTITYHADGSYDKVVRCEADGFADQIVHVNKDGTVTGYTELSRGRRTYLNEDGSETSIRYTEQEDYTYSTDGKNVVKCERTLIFEDGRKVKVFETEYDKKGDLKNTKAFDRETGEQLNEDEAILAQYTKFVPIVFDNHGNRISGGSTGGHLTSFHYDVKNDNIIRTPDKDVDFYINKW